MALHCNIKKSLLFTAYFVNGNLTCVRCNLTGKFVKHSIYFAVKNETTTAYGVTIDFSVKNTVSLFDDYINVLDVLFLALFSVLTLSVLTVSLTNLFL